MNYNARKRLKKNIFNAKDQLQYYQNEKFRIIYLDETMITKSTICNREFTCPYSRVEIPSACLNETAIALIGGVSKEKGVDLAMTFKNSVNIPKFKIYL